MNDYPVPFAHSVVAVDGQGRVLWEQGDVARVFPLASVTKIITSLATLRAVQQGATSLVEVVGNAPIPEPSNGQTVERGTGPGAAPAPYTVAHLLSHSSGLDAEGDGSRFRDQPARRRIYSNQGFDVLGRFMERKTGERTSRWIDREVVAPLGLQSTTVPRSPARSGFGSALDLSVLIEELLQPQLLDPKTLRSFTGVSLPGLRGVLPGYGMQRNNDWGLGVEIKGDKSPHWTPPSSSPHTFGHFGMSGSFLWVDPVRQVGAAFLGAEPFGSWHKENWPRLGEQILQASY